MIFVGNSNGKSGSVRNGSGFPIICLCSVLFGLVLSGCATRKEILTFKENSEYTRSQLDTLNLNLQNLRMQIDGLQIRQDRLVEDMVTQSDLRQFRAYMSSRLNDYESQTFMLSAQINDLSQRLTGVAQSFDEMKYRVSEPDSTDTTDTGEVTPPPELKELYDQAYHDLTRGNYELAKSGFAEYLRLYADTELADNALYWMGEADYVQHNYTEALEKFQQVSEKYPEGNKVPSAIFKVGLCQVALKLIDEAKQTFSTLIRDYPATPEAAQAEARLNELD